MRPPIAAAIQLDWDLGPLFVGGKLSEAAPRRSYYVWQTLGEEGVRVLQVDPFIFNVIRRPELGPLNDVRLVAETVVEDPTYDASVLMDRLAAARQLGLIE
jgi:hypothetical protein